MLRTSLIVALGRTGYPPVLNESRRLVREYFEHPLNNTIPVELRAAVYATALAFGDNATLEQFLEVGKMEKNSRKYCSCVLQCEIV